MNIVLHINLLHLRSMYRFVRIGKLLYREWSLWFKFFGKILIIVGPKFSGKSRFLLKMLEYFPNLNVIDDKTITAQSLNVSGQNRVFDLYYNATKPYIFSGKDVIISNTWHNHVNLQALHGGFNEYPFLKVLLLFSSLTTVIGSCFDNNKLWLRSLRKHVNRAQKIKKMSLNMHLSTCSYVEPVEVLNSYFNFYGFTGNKENCKNYLDELDKSTYKNILYAINAQQLNMLKFFYQFGIRNPVKCFMVLPEQQLPDFFHTNHCFYVFNKFSYDFLISVSPENIDDNFRKDFSPVLQWLYNNNEVRTPEVIKYSNQDQYNHNSSEQFSNYPLLPECNLKG